MAPKTKPQKASKKCAQTKLSLESATDVLEGNVSLAQLITTQIPRKKSGSARKKRKLKQTKLSFLSKRDDNLSSGSDAQDGALSIVGNSIHGTSTERIVEDRLDSVESEEAARKKLVGLLMRTFAKNYGSAELARCQRIEDALYSLTRSMEVGGWREYRLRARSIIFNLKATDGVLLKRVCNDEVSPEELVRLRAEDLASDSLKAERLVERDRYFKSEIYVTERVRKRKRDTYQSRNAAPEQAAGDNSVPNDYSIEMTQGDPIGVTVSRKVHVRTSKERLDVGMNGNLGLIAVSNDGNARDASLDESISDSETSDSDESGSDDSSTSTSDQEDVPNLEVSSIHPRPVTDGDEELARALEDLSSSSSSTSSSQSSEEAIATVPAEDSNLAALLEMGFDSDRASDALVAASGDLHRAVSNLCET